MVAKETNSSIALSEAENSKASVEGRGRFASEVRTANVIAMTLVPWIAVVLFTAGAWAGLHTVGYAVIVIAIGYVVIRIALPYSARAESMVFAPAAGILVVSALTAFWVRIGLPISRVCFLWFVLAALGATWLWLDRRDWMKSTTAYGKSLVILSVLICGIYFVPGARNDAVLRHDGSFNWIYVDTQYFHSMAASIKSSDGPPRDPGTATEELLYHFGPYSPAAVISRLDGLDLGDAFARVTRGASLWALVLSCFGLGTLLSLKATGAKFGGIASVAGLFFYGSLLSLFTDERVSSSHVTGAILFTIPGIAVTADGGPFSHLILGHSVLNGLIAITVVMGLCLFQSGLDSEFTWRELALLTLPALAVPMHSVAGLYCFGVVSILIFWGRLKAIRSWLLILLMACLFLGAWRIMGSVHSADATLTTINRAPGNYWWTIAVWFIVGLGFRITGFRWVNRSLKDPFSALVFASALGVLSFYILIQFPREEERYGAYFLQSVFSVFAFSRLSNGCWRGSERARWTEEWLGTARKCILFLIAYAVLMRIAHFITHSQAWITYTRMELVSLILLGLVVVGVSALMKRNCRLSMIGSAIIMGVLSIGFLAWVTPWLNFGQGRMKMDVTLAPGEVQGLRQLRNLAAPDERFATNKHAISIMTADQYRSYAYAALAERPVLLEGYAYHSETANPDFKNLLFDNDLMFNTMDPETVRNLARKWHVRWLVARPGTDLALPRPLPTWLAEQKDSGDLKIYRID